MRGKRLGQHMPANSSAANASARNIMGGNPDALMGTSSDPARLITILAGMKKARHVAGPRTNPPHRKSVPVAVVIAALE